MRTVQINHKALIRFLLILLMIWIVWWPIVTSGNIRMDSDRMIHTPDVALTQYVREGRIALVWLLRLFGLDTWHPVRSGVLFLVFFSFSCGLLYFTLRRQTGWRNLYPDLFLLLYGLSPIWAYHGYFVVQIAAVGLGMMLSVLTACADIRFISRPAVRSLRLLWEAAALILLVFTLLIYQSLIVCYLSVLLVMLFCFLLHGGRISWRQLLPYILRLFCALVIWFVVTRALHTDSTATNMDVQIRWGADSLPHCILRIAQEAGATLLMVTSRYFSLYTLGAVLVLLLLIRRRKTRTAGNPWLTAVFLAMLLLPFGLSVLLGNVTVPRSQFALQLVAAFLPVCFLAETEGRHRVLCGICVAAVVIQTGLAVRLYHTDQVRNSQDLAAAEAISAGLKDADPSVPLAFVGVRTMEGHPVLTEKADVYGRSFFEWIYSPDHPTSSTIPALRLLTAYDGRQYEGITSPEQEREAVAAAGDMPAYPSPGFVRQEPGMVIIKLSNP